MADNHSRCRGIGALAALWDQARQAEDSSPAGLRILVDLDEGTVSAVPWNEAGFETTGESWQGQGVLGGLQQAVAPLFDTDPASIPALLLDGNAMAACAESINKPVFYNPNTDIELNGRSIRLGQLFSDLDLIAGAVRAMAGQTAVFFPAAAEAFDTEEDRGRVILYGTCAGYRPLQLLFQSAVRQYDDIWPYLPLGKADSLFTYVCDDGGLAQRGWQLLDSGAVAFGPPTAPADLTLLLTDANGSEIPVPLAAKGQTADQLAPETPAFFLAPGSALRLLVDGTSRQFPLPEAFLRGGCAAVAKVKLENRTLSLFLRDASDSTINHSMTINTEVH